jgi:hypothetical protein
MAPGDPESEHERICQANREQIMDWLTRIRRAFVARRKHPALRDGADDAARGEAAARASHYDSSFGYGALVIGTSQQSSRHRH